MAFDENRDEIDDEIELFEMGKPEKIKPRPWLLPPSIMSDRRIRTREEIEQLVKLLTAQPEGPSN